MIEHRKTKHALTSRSWRRTYRTNSQYRFKYCRFLKHTEEESPFTYITYKKKHSAQIKHPLGDKVSCPDVRHMLGTTFL